MDALPGVNDLPTGHENEQSRVPARGGPKKAQGVENMPAVRRYATNMRGPGECGEQTANGKIRPERVYRRRIALVRSSAAAR